MYCINNNNITGSDSKENVIQVICIFRSLTMRKAHMHTDTHIHRGSSLVLRILFYF